MKRLFLYCVTVVLLLAVQQCSPVDEPSPIVDPEPQQPVKKYLSISLQTKEVGNVAGSFELNVTSNCEWKASSDATWLSPSKTGASRGEVILINYSGNTEVLTRTAKILFTADGVESQTLTVTQTGNFVEISVRQKEVDNAGATVTFAVSSNCSWTVSSDASWAAPASAKGSSSGSVNVVCSQNDNPSTRRTATISITGDGMDPVLCTITQGKTFTNPIGGVPDPYIVKDGNSYYLVKAATGVNISRSDKLSYLNSTKEVWRPEIDSKTAWNTSHVWAPEMHKVNGHWYVYYTAGRPSSESGGSYKMQRSGVLKAKTDDPLGQWEDMGMLYTGDNWYEGIIPTANNTKYGIDLTVFTLRDQLYAVWSGAAGPNDSNQSIYIATMSDPCTISCSRIRLSSAESVWERQNSQIQEGPSVLQHGDKIFIVYSCNGSWTKYYRLGYLVMDKDKDPLVKANWTKSPDQVFYRCDDTADTDGVNGVGHCTFTVSPDGTEDWIVYHAKNKNDNTYTTGRSTYLKRFTWKADGTPDFGNPPGYKEPILVPSGE